MKETRQRYQQIADGVMRALTGQSSALMTLMAYSSIALLLLGYVSAQVYAGMLRQDIETYKHSQRAERESLNWVTSEHVARTSRHSVGRYCEKTLSMRESPVSAMQRFVVDLNADQFPAILRFADKSRTVNEERRYTVGGAGAQPTP